MIKDDHPLIAAVLYVAEACLHLLDAKAGIASDASLVPDECALPQIEGLNVLYVCPVVIEARVSEGGRIKKLQSRPGQTGRVVIFASVTIDSEGAGRTSLQILRGGHVHRWSGAFKSREPEGPKAVFRLWHNEWTNLSIEGFKPLPSTRDVLNWKV